MSEPSKLTSNSAIIYGADLMYEQNCKCGITEVILEEEAWSSDTLGDKAWKIVALQDESTLEGLVMDNMSTGDQNKLVSLVYKAGQEIMGTITEASALAGGWIIYKDCKQS